MVDTFVKSAKTRCEIFKCDQFKLAAALDPRWKLSWCDNEEEASRIKSVIKTELETLSPLPANSETNNPAASPPRKRSRFLSYLHKKPVSQPEGQDKYSIQIGDYFRAPEIGEEDNPLAFWEVNQTQFPSLANLACRYLHIPASSSPVERVFSIAGRVFRPDRATASNCILSSNCNTSYK